LLKKVLDPLVLFIYNLCLDLIIFLCYKLILKLCTEGIQLMLGFIIKYLVYCCCNFIDYNSSIVQFS